MADKSAPLYPSRKQRPATEGLAPYLTGVGPEEVGLQQAGKRAKGLLSSGGGASPKAQPEGPLTPGDELPFGEAFKRARRAGVENFRWRDTLFNTRYKGETDTQWEALRQKARQSAQTAKQADLKKTEAGKAVSGGLIDEINEKLDALFSMNEAIISEHFGSLSQVQDMFQSAAREAGKMPGGWRTPEADVFRHVAGAREATQQAGILPTFIGPQGHELNTLINLAKGRMQQPGFTPGRYVAESAQDTINNLIGQLQAISNMLGVGGLASQEGVSIDYPDTTMARVGSGIENTVNRVAQWLRPGGLEEKNAEPQV